MLISRVLPSRTMRLMLFRPQTGKGYHGDCVFTFPLPTAWSWACCHDDGPDSSPLALESMWFIDIIPIPACSRMLYQEVCVCVCVCLHMGVLFHMCTATLGAVKNKRALRNKRHKAKCALETQSSHTAVHSVYFMHVFSFRRRRTFLFNLPL